LGLDYGEGKKYESCAGGNPQKESGGELKKATSLKRSSSWSCSKKEKILIGPKPPRKIRQGKSFHRGDDFLVRHGRGQLETKVLGVRKGGDKGLWAGRGIVWGQIVASHPGECTYMRRGKSDCWGKAAGGGSLEH